MKLYVNPDCRTREELERRVVRGELVEVFGRDQGEIPRNGPVEVECRLGRWRVRGVMEEGHLVLVA